MNKCVIVSDSFKGTLSSKEIANIFENKLKEHFPSCKLEKVILSDGGEGFIESIEENIEGKRINITVSGPYLERIETYYYISNANIAYIESANAIGLKLAENNLNPAKTTSFGVGEMIKDAIMKGAKKIYIGLGGTCTNDGGAGCLSALGTIFVNKRGRIFIPTGESLNDISFIDNEQTKEFINGVEIIILSDVKNPLYGELGASYVFAKQKGASDEMIKMLDDNLVHYANEIKRCLNVDVSIIEGGGAAGGIGAGLYAILNAKIESGIETILKEADFDKLIDGANYIFTGEGSFDSQSINGKAISGIVEHAKSKNIPVIIVSGSVKEDVEKYTGSGFSCAFSTNRTSDGYNVLKYKQKENYEYTIDNILRLIKLCEN